MMCLSKFARVSSFRCLDLRVVARQRYCAALQALKKSIAVGVAEIENFNTNNTNYSIYNLSGKSAVLTIDWDDGTVQVIQNYIGDEVIHYYAIAGTFEVQTSITFLDRFGDFQTIDDGFIIAGHCCPLKIN